MTHSMRPLDPVWEAAAVFRSVARYTLTAFAIAVAGLIGTAAPRLTANLADGAAAARKVFWSC